MAGRTITRPAVEPAPAYRAILDEMRALATAPPSEDPEENAARLHGLWAIQEAAQDILRTAMATLNEPGPGFLSLSDQGALFDKHRSTIQQHVYAGRKLLKEPAR